MRTDLPLALQGGGTITWANLKSHFAPDALSQLARYWQLTQGTNIVDTSAFDVGVCRDFYLNGRLIA